MRTPIALIIAIAAGAAAPPLPSWIEARRVEVEASAEPRAMALFELAEEVAALADHPDPAVSLAASREGRRLLAEAVRLDESLGVPALRLAVATAGDEAVRRRLALVLATLDRGRRDLADPEVARSVGEFLSLYRRGEVEDASRLAALAEVRIAIEGVDPLIEGGLDRIDRDLRSGRPPLLRLDERRRLLEFERAILDPERSGFAASAWFDRWSPLPEVDAGGIAFWLEGDR